MHVLKIRDGNGNLVPIPAIRGERGKSAYEQAKEGGYQGTEEEFIAILNGFINPVSPVDVDPSHIDDKNNPHKVTAEQTGALPIKGGEMEGAIKWNGGQAHILGQGDGNFIIQNYKTSETGHDDFLSFHNTLDLAGALTFHRDGKPYTIYGMHNKPSATDIGAVSDKGDTLTGYLNFNNPEEYYALSKVRTVGETDHKLTLGVASTGGTTLEHYTGDLLDARMELDASGLSFKKGASSPVEKIFGEHNKRTGTYQGTGNAILQTIPTNSIGSFILITDGTKNIFVGPGGAIVQHNATIYGLSPLEIKYENGVLSITTSNSNVNCAGVTYTYQCL